MDQPIERDVDGMAQHALERPIAVISADQAVAVVDPHASTLTLQRHRAVMRRDSEIVREERSQPEIVVAVPVIHRDSLRAQPAEDLERLKIAARNGCAVFEPEIEQVADDDETGKAAGE